MFLHRYPVCYVDASRLVAGLAWVGLWLGPACAQPAEEAQEPDAGGLFEPDAGELSEPDAGAGTGPIGEWAWHDVPGSMCANGTPTGFGANRGVGSTVVIYMSGGSACLDAGCTIGTPSMRKDGGFGEAELQDCVAGHCDGSVTFPLQSIFDREAAANPFTDATYVFISNCSGDYYVGDNDHEFPGWTAHFHGADNQALFAAQVAASFPNTSRIVLTGGSAGSVGAMLNYWRWVEAFPDTRVDLVSDSFALVFEDGPQWRYSLHNPQTPPGCATCTTDYRTVYEFNASLAPGARIAVLDSEDDWTLDFTTGYTYTQGLEALQDYLDPLPNTRYYVANGSTHILLGSALDSATTDCTEQVCEDGMLARRTHYLSEFLTRMQSDDPAWESLSSLGGDTAGDCVSSTR